MIYPNVYNIMLCLAYPTNCIRFKIQKIKECMPTKNNFIVPFPDHPFRRVVRKNTGPSKNGRVELTHLHTYVCTRALHSV